MPDYINPKRIFVGCFLPNWLRERTELTMTAKVLYATLAQHSNDDGVAWPSQETLVAEMGCSRKAVHNAVVLLESHGLIEADRSGFATSNKYRFPAHEWMGVHTGKICSSDEQKVHVVGVKIAKDKNHLKESSKRDIGIDDSVRRVVGRMNSLSGRNLPSSGGQAKYIRARLREGAKEDDLVLVAESKWDEWGHQDKMRKYFRPQTLYSKEHFEDYLENAKEELTKPKRGFVEID